MPQIIKIKKMNKKIIIIVVCIILVIIWVVFWKSFIKRNHSDIENFTTGEEQQQVADNQIKVEIDQDYEAIKDNLNLIKSEDFSENELSDEKIGI